MGFSDFFKRKQGYQISSYLSQHSLKDKYFYRLIPFRKLDNKTAVAFDNKSPGVITFDPWPQTIFLNATGLKTIYDFIAEIAEMYKGNVPPRLEETVIEETEKLINRGIIAVADERVALSADLLYPTT